MKYTNIVPSIVSAVLSCLVSGCVNHTTVKDATRKPIQFTSPLAAQTFYDTYLSTADPNGRGSVVVFLPLPYSHRTVATDNVRFNSAAQVADSNCDGVVSENEARAFAVSVHSQKLALSREP